MQPGAFCIPTMAARTPAKAEDAVLLDNSRLTLEETAKAIMKICEKKWEVRQANV